MEKSQAAHEIEDTLRLAGDDVEREISHYRVIVFAVVVVTVAAMRFFFPATSTLVVFYFVGVLCYAVLLRRYILRRGRPAWIGQVALVCDMALSVAIFPVLGKLAPHDVGADHWVFATAIAAPALMTTILIGSLRNDERNSRLAMVAAPVCFIACIGLVHGFVLADVPVIVILVLSGALSLAAARRAKTNLETFARLQLLRRFLPAAAVDRVMREDPGKALSLGGKLVTVTVLASDLRGFTAMSEKLTPDEVVTQLNAYHGAMMGVIDAHGGAIDKFIGDGTLVVFGFNGSAEEAARDAVACARAMMSALEIHNRGREEKGLGALEMGIGIHTGPVVAGNIGVSGRRLEFTVIGDAVNTASRLEGQTKSSGTPVVISAATFDLLPDKTGLRELSPASIRGKQATMRIYGLTEPTRPPSAKAH
jgi:class 3 adenylate cyclase